MSTAFFEFATNPSALETVVKTTEQQPGRMTKADAAAYGSMCGIALALSALQSLKPRERAKVLAQFAKDDPLGPRYFPRDFYLALCRVEKESK